MDRRAPAELAEGVSAAKHVSIISITATVRAYTCLGVVPHFSSMSGYDRRYGHSPPSRPLADPPPSRMPADYGSQQRRSLNPHPGLSSNSNKDPSMASVAAWREQQASLAVSGNLDDDDRLDDNASSEGLGAKRSHDSHGDSRDEPRRKRMVTTPHRKSNMSFENKVRQMACYIYSACRTAVS